MSDTPDNAPSGGCPDAVTLAAYLDGMLTGPELARLDAHIAQCPQCASDVAELRTILAASAQVPGNDDLVGQAVAAARGLVRK